MTEKNTNGKLRKRDSRRKGKFIYSIFWCFPTCFLCKKDLHFQVALWPLCIKPCSPKISLLHLTHCSFTSESLRKLLWRWPSSASVPCSFSLFFKTRKTQPLLSRGQSYNISPCILHPYFCSVRIST